MFNAKTIILAKALRPDLNFASPGAEELIWLNIASRYASGNPVRNATIENGIAYFDRVTASQPLVSLLLNLPVTQQGSGTPSPDNIRDFIGFSDVNVSRTGINLWDEEWKNGAYSESNGTPYYSERIRNKNPILVKGISSIYRCGPATSQVFFYDRSMNFIGVGGWGKANVVSIPDNTSWMNFNINPNYGSTYNNDFSFNYPSTDTSYHAYTGNTYQITFGQTVYSANLDVLTGKLSITHELKTIDENSGVTRATTNVFYLPDFFDTENDTESINCNIYERGENKSTGGGVVSNPDYSFCCRTTSNQLYIKDVRYNTITDYNDYLANNPVKIAVKLSEPIEVQLLPTQISTLIGENVIFADVADVTECKYTRK